MRFRVCVGFYGVRVCQPWLLQPRQGLKSPALPSMGAWRGLRVRLSRGSVQQWRVMRWPGQGALRERDEREGLAGLPPARAAGLGVATCWLYLRPASNVFQGVTGGVPAVRAHRRLAHGLPCTSSTVH